MVLWWCRVVYHILGFLCSILRVNVISLSASSAGLLVRGRQQSMTTLWVNSKRLNFYHDIRYQIGEFRQYVIEWHRNRIYLVEWG